MRVVVTGATGFVGQALVPRLLPDHEVFGLVRDGERPLPGGAIPLEGDLSAYDGLARLPDDADVVIHLAQGSGSYPDDARALFEVNAGSTSRLLDYSDRAGVRRFILASTGSVYALSPSPLSEDSPLAASLDFYALTKRVAEVLVLGRAASLEVAVLRLFAPYGPGQRGRLIPRLIEAVRSGAPVTLRGGGAPRLNPIWIGDLVEILRQAVEGSGSGVVNVAGPRAVGIRDIALIAAAALGVEPRFVEDSAPSHGDLVADTTLMETVFRARSLVDPTVGIARVLEEDRTRA